MSPILQTPILPSTSDKVRSLISFSFRLFPRTKEFRVSATAVALSSEDSQNELSTKNEENIINLPKELIDTSFIPMEDISNVRTSPNMMQNVERKANHSGDNDYTNLGTMDKYSK